MAARNGNGDNVANLDADARYAALSERVTSLSSQFASLRAETLGGIGDVQRQVASLAAEMRTAQRPQWQALSVILAAFVAIGALAYWPIREQMADLKAVDAKIIEALAMIPDKFVNKSDQQVLRDRASQDRDVLNKTLDQKVERSQFADLKERVDRLEGKPQ